MPGRQTGDNKFGVSPFIVGAVLGDGCNYSTIQSAIDDCFASGGGVVWIRPSNTPYVENLTLRSGVNLNSTEDDGRIPAVFNKVVIDGQHTFAPTGGFGITVMNCICFNDSTFGDIFTVSPTVGTFAILAIKFCGIFSNSGGGAGRPFVLSPDGTSLALLPIQTCNIDGGLTAIDCIGAGSHQIQAFESSVVASTLNAVNFSSGTASIDFTLCEARGGTFGIEDLTGTASILMDRSNLSGPSGAISFTTPGGSCSSQHSTYSGNGINPIVGTGSFIHADSIMLSGTVIPGTITETKSDWQPYCSMGASASPATIAPRGTSAFDSASFIVSDGWVQLASGSTTNSFVTDSGTATPVAGVINVLGGPGVTTSAAGNTVTINTVVWTDFIAPGLVTSDSGSFDTVGGLTLTLPAAPLQGDECRFIAINSGTVVQANAGQQITIGNQNSTVGGTATSSQGGDTLWLTFNAGTLRWFAFPPQGNWTLA